MSDHDYEVLIAPLSAEEGGGFVAVVPDLIGCIADGETQEEALANVRDAIIEWCDAQKEMGREVPAPGDARRSQMAEDEQIADALEHQGKLVEAMRKRIRELESRKIAPIIGVSGWTGTEQLIIHKSRRTQPQH